jgi:hypothetical protein
MVQDEPSKGDMVQDEPSKGDRKGRPYHDHTSACEGASW